MSSKDVVVVVSLEQVDTSVDSLDILLISTAGEKTAKDYTALEDIEADWGKTSDMYKMAAQKIGRASCRERV